MAYVSARKGIPRDFAPLHDHGDNGKDGVINDLRDHLASQLEDIERVNKTNNMLVLENKGLKENANRKTAENSGLIENIKQMEIKSREVAASSAKTLADLRAKISMLEQQISRVEASEAAIKAEVKDAKAKHIVEVKKLNSTITELKKAASSPKK